MTMSEYYTFYLSLHQNKWCRRFHFLGQITTIMFVSGCLYFQWYWLLLAAPFVVYPFAWVGHLVFEKNRPLAWDGIKDGGITTLKAKACDWIMFKDILIGKLER